MGKDDINKNYIKLEEEAIERVENYRREMNKIQQNIKQTDDKFTSRFLEHASIIDKRIKSIDDEIIKFEKGTKLFTKVDSLKEKLNNEIKFIKEELANIKKDRNEVLKIEKKIMMIDDISKDSQERYNKIANEHQKIENLEVVFKELKEISETVDGKLDNIKGARIIIQNVEEKINTINGKIDLLDKHYDEVESKDSQIVEYFKKIEGLKNISEDLRDRYGNIKKQYDDLEFKRSIYEKSFKEFEKEANLITKSEKKVAEVIDKFKQMDSLVEDLEARTEVINKYREWLVKAETQIVNLNQDTDKKIKILETLLNNSSKSSVIKNKLDDEGVKKETVLKLRKQGWTIDEISKTLNLSAGEVEFILDLEHNKIK